MNKDEFSLYFIAIVPPSPLREEAWHLKEYFRDHYQSKAALKSPPHITLHMPFRFKQKKEEMLVNTLAHFAAGQPSFELKLQDFGAFPPRVIYIDVKSTTELQVLQKDLVRTCRLQLKLLNANYKKQAFHPHITLAFRDLRKSLFYEAWEEFKTRTFAGHFTADRICLLKHNGKSWDIHHEFIMGSREESYS